MFFFEKKNQKTFITLPTATTKPSDQDPGGAIGKVTKVFLLLFLQKKKSLSSTSS
jgi:hypothetical protein